MKQRDENIDEEIKEDMLRHTGKDHPT